MSAIDGVPEGPMPGGVVADDVPCRKCGYDLRGLSIEGRCPECGTSVGLSLRGDLLCYSDPVWVGTLQRGFRLMILGVTVIVVSVVLAVLLGMARIPGMGLFIELATLGGWLLYLWGTWLITERDPSGIGEDQYGTARKLIRIGVVANVVGQVVERAAGDRASPELAMVVRVISVGIGIVFVVATFAELQYLEKLAMRIPDITHSRRARFLKWAIAVTYAVPVLMAAMVLVLGRAGAMLGACVGLPVVLAIVVFGLMYLRLLSNLKNCFGVQAEIARSTWAVGDTTTTA